MPVIHHASRLKIHTICLLHDNGSEPFQHIFSARWQDVKLACFVSRVHWRDCRRKAFCFQWTYSTSSCSCLAPPALGSTGRDGHRHLATRSSPQPFPSGNFAPECLRWNSVPWIAFPSILSGNHGKFHRAQREPQPGPPNKVPGQEAGLFLKCSVSPIGMVVVVPYVGYGCVFRVLFTSYEPISHYSNPCYSH